MKLRGLRNNGPSEIRGYVTGWFEFTSVKATSRGESLSSYSTMGGSSPPPPPWLRHPAAPGASSVSHSDANSCHLGGWFLSFWHLEWPQRLETSLKFYFICMYIGVLPAQPKRDFRSPGTRVTYDCELPRVLKIIPGFSARAASTLYHGAMSTAFRFFFFLPFFNLN